MYINDCVLLILSLSHLKPRGSGSVGILGGSFTAYITSPLHYLFLSRLLVCILNRVNSLN